MDDGSRIGDAGRDTSWTGNLAGENFQSWLERIHREAMEHSAAIHGRQNHPVWMRN